MGDIQHNLEDVLMSKNKQVQRLEEQLSDVKKVIQCLFLVSRSVNSPILRPCVAAVRRHDSQVRGEVGPVQDTRRGTRIRAPPRALAAVCCASVPF